MSLARTSRVQGFEGTDDCEELYVNRKSEGEMRTRSLPFRDLVDRK